MGTHLWIANVDWSAILGMDNVQRDPKVQDITVDPENTANQNIDSTMLLFISMKDTNSMFTGRPRMMPFCR